MYWRFRTSTLEFRAPLAISDILTLAIYALTSSQKNSKKCSPPTHQPKENSGRGNEPVAKCRVPKPRRNPSRDRDPRGTPLSTKVAAGIDLTCGCRLGHGRAKARWGGGRQPAT